MLCRTDFTAVGHSTSYCLRQRHVQLALRYFRSDIEQDYLARLLAPYSVVGMTNNQDLIQKFSARAHIIDGRFILHSAWSFCPSKLFSRFSISQLRVLQLCPHLSYLRDANPALRTNHLTHVMGYAEQNFGTQTRSSCPRCTTDFTIEIDEEGLLVHVYQDFGSSGSPADPIWHVHVFSEGNNQFQGPTVQHEAHSIRAKYKEWKWKADLKRMKIYYENSAAEGRKRLEERADSKRLKVDYAQLVAERRRLLDERAELEAERGRRIEERLDMERPKFRAAQLEAEGRRRLDERADSKRPEFYYAHLLAERRRLREQSHLAQLEAERRRRL